MQHICVAGLYFISNFYRNNYITIFIDWKRKFSLRMGGIKMWQTINAMKEKSNWTSVACKDSLWKLSTIYSFPVSLYASLSPCDTPYFAEIHTPLKVTCLQQKNLHICIHYKVIFTKYKLHAANFLDHNKFMPWRRSKQYFILHMGKIWTPDTNPNFHHLLSSRNILINIPILTSSTAKVIDA